MYSKDENRKLRKEFWSAFSEYTKFYSMKIGEPIQWVFYRTGVKGVELKFDLENKVVRVILEVNVKNIDKRFDIYVELDKYKSIINSDFNDKLLWFEDYQLPEDKFVSRIFVELYGLNFHNRDKWPEIFLFMAENMFKLQTNFMDIQPLLKEKFDV